MKKWATYNANSVRARLPLILSWLERERPWVLFLQETKVQDKDFPAKAFEEKGYHCVYRGQKSYNGVAILSLEPLAHVSFEGPGKDAGDARFISARAGDVRLLNLYVPQGLDPASEKFQYKLKWLEEFSSFLEGNLKRDEEILAGGDFNVALEPRDVYDPEGLRGQVGFHPKEQELMKRILGWGLVDLMRLHHPEEEGIYTFWDYRIPNAFKRRMGWRIDYLLASEPFARRTKECLVDVESRLMPQPSDHAFLVTETD